MRLRAAMHKKKFRKEVRNDGIAVEEKLIIRTSVSR